MATAQVAQHSPQSQPSILYNGAVRLDFDAGAHKYTVTDERGSRNVPSVTTILGIIDKSGPLTQWAANQTSEYIRAAIRPGMRYDEIQLGEILERARFQFRTISRGAKTIGQLAHEWVEAHLRSRWGGQELPLPINEQAKSACQAAAAWIAAHFKPLSMEHRIYSRENEFAGTIDVFGDVDGQPAIVDWKAAGAIYREFRLQTAAYAQAWAEMNDDRVPDRWVIRLDKDSGEFEAVKFPREDFRRDLRGFLAAKQLHLTLEAIKTPQASKPTPKPQPAPQPQRPVTPKRGPMAPPPAQLPPQQPAAAARATGRIEGFAPQSYQPRRGYNKPKAGPRIRWAQMQDALILAGGGTFKLQGILIDLGGMRSFDKERDCWIWQLPVSQFSALQCACNEEGIRLVAAGGGRVA
jgi:hypothetical protein